MAVDGAERGAFAVDGLRAGDEDLADGQLLVADDLEHLRGAEAVDEDVLGHLGHVAAVGRLVEDDVDVFERGVHGVVVLHVALAELGCRIDPCGFAMFVGLGLEIIEDAHRPAFAHKQIDDVRADQACAAGDERSFLM